MSGISTHILDTANGKPAAGIAVHLYREDTLISEHVTNNDGRVGVLLPADAPFLPGKYRLIFDVAEYFLKSFFPEIVIVFQVSDTAAHYHVPLLLSPFGYSTYRGS